MLASCSKLWPVLEVTQPFKIEKKLHQQQILTAGLHGVVYLHSVSYVYAVLPFYDVKCLCSGGRE